MSNEENFNFGEFLYKARRKIYLSQKTMAERLGYVQSTYCSFENNSRQPTDRIVAALIEFGKAHKIRIPVTNIRKLVKERKENVSTNEASGWVY